MKISHNAVARIIHAHGLTRPRKKKPATKKQLSETRMEALWPNHRRYEIPSGYFELLAANRASPPTRFQYTAREVVSGACFAGYADELSKSYAVFLAEQLSAHLALHGVDLSQVFGKPTTAASFRKTKKSAACLRPCALSWIGPSLHPAQTLHLAKRRRNRPSLSGR